MVEQRLEGLGTEPEHGSQRSDGLLGRVKRNIESQFAQKRLGTLEVGAPSVGEDREVVGVVRGRGSQEAQTRLGVEGGDDVLDEVSRGKQVLEALVGESVTHRIRVELSDLLVVRVAHDVVVVDDVLPRHEEGADVAPPVLHEAHLDVVGQPLAGSLDLLHLLRAGGAQEDVDALGHVADVLQRGLDQIHVVQMRDEGDLLLLGLADDRLRGQDVGELEILHQVRHVHRAQGVVPDEVRVEVRVVAQVGVELDTGLAHGLVEDVVVGAEEGAALEDRAALVPDDLDRGEEDRAEGVALHVLGVDVDVGGEAEALEALGEGHLVQTHRLLVAVDLRHLVPIVLEGLGGHQGATVGVEVGLEVSGQVALEGIAEGVVSDLVEPGDAPEIDVPAGHLGEHLLEGVDRPHDGGVEQDDLVELGELLPAVGVQARLVGPDIQPLVLPQDDVVREDAQLGVALGRQLAVDDDDQLGEVLHHIGEQGLHVGVHDALGIEEEEDAESRRVLAKRCHVVPSGQCFGPLTAAEERAEECVFSGRVNSRLRRGYGGSSSDRPTRRASRRDDPGRHRTPG